MNGTSPGMSKFSDMQKRLVILVVVGVALVGITAVITSEGLPLIPSKVAPVSIAVNDAGQPSNLPDPGFYMAEPYYIMVLVPGPVEPRMMVESYDASLSNMPCIKPELRLKRR